MGEKFVHWYYDIALGEEINKISWGKKVVEKGFEISYWERGIEHVIKFSNK